MAIGICQGIVQRFLKNPIKKNADPNIPPIAEQLDMIYWDKVNGTNLWQEKFAEIKAKYPKS